MKERQDPRMFDSDFFAALQIEDELGAVVRAHIHIESCLNSLLEGWMIRPASLVRMQL